MILDFNTFATLVVDWCELRQNQFKLMFPLKGGWEAWTQADWAAFALNQNSTYDILREQAIYANPNQRVDWLLNDNAATIQKIAIELKCQSFENRNVFTTGLQADIDKLQQGNLKPAYQGCQTGVMGIYFEESARNWVLANGFIEVFNNSDVGCAIKRLA